MPIAGTTLRAERTKAYISVTDLAARMGLSRQALWATERSGAVSPARVAAYRQALQACIDAKMTSPVEAA